MPRRCRVHTTTVLVTHDQHARGSPLARSDEFDIRVRGTTPATNPDERSVAGDEPCRPIDQRLHRARRSRRLQATTVTPSSDHRAPSAARWLITLVHSSRPHSGRMIARCPPHSAVRWKSAGPSLRRSGRGRSITTHRISVHQVRWVPQSGPSAVPDNHVDIPLSRRAGRPSRSHLTGSSGRLPAHPV
jgi:hypothetical protein